MNGFFSFFGKLTFGLLIIGLLVGGGYYLGKGKLPSLNYNPQTIVTTTTAETPTPTLTMEATISASPSPTIATQQIHGGGVSGTSFNTYTVTIPNTWTVKKETNTGVSEKVTISRNGYA